MQLAYLCSVAYVCFFVALIFVLDRIKMKERTLKVLFFLFALSLANIAFAKDPPRAWDLTFHLAYMDQIRNSSLSFFEFLFHNTSWVGGYPFFFTFNLLRYIICHLSDNNHWLPWTCVLIDYCIVGYIMRDWSKEHEKNGKVTWLSFLICFGLLPFVHANSGMRNALAFSLIGLGIYLYLYKRKHVLFFAVLSFMALTIHPSVLICIPFVFLARFNLRKKGLILVFAASVSIEWAAQYLASHATGLFQMVGHLYLRYSGAGQFQLDPVVLLGTLAIVGLFFAQCCIADFSHCTNAEQNIYAFLAYYMCFILSNVGNNDLVVRPAYLLGVLAPLLATLARRKSFWGNIRNQSAQPLAYAACAALCGFMILQYAALYISA